MNERPEEVDAAFNCLERYASGGAIISTSFIHIMAETSTVLREYVEYLEGLLSSKSKVMEHPFHELPKEETVDLEC